MAERSRPAASGRSRVPDRRRDERGAATVLVVGLAITLLVCAGLIVDGGGALNARGKLADDVEQAARAGAREIDVTLLHEQGVESLDVEAARSTARSYLARLGYSRIGVQVDAETITVRAEDSVDTVMLNLIGIRRFDVSATATAEAQSG